MTYKMERYDKEIYEIYKKVIATCFWSIITSNAIAKAKLRPV